MCQNQFPIFSILQTFAIVGPLAGVRTNSYLVARTARPNVVHLSSMIPATCLAGARPKCPRTCCLFLGVVPRRCCASSRTTCVYAATASESSPSLPGHRAKASMNFVAAMWLEDVPCLVNTAYQPSTSFTMSPLKTTQPL